MASTAAEDRAFKLYYARVMLAAAMEFRHRGIFKSGRGWHAFLLECAAKARREAASIETQLSLNF